MTPRCQIRKSPTREADRSQDLLKPERSRSGRSAYGRGSLLNGTEQRGKIHGNMLVTISWRNPEEFVI